MELPPNICSPPFLAEVAALLAAQFPDVLQLEVRAGPGAELLQYALNPKP